MNAIQFLKQEHQTAKAAFEKVLQASPAKRGDLWEELTPELEAHEEIEDTCLYQPLSRDAGGKDAKLAEWRQKHQSEVEKVGNLIGEIDELEPEDDKWLTKVKKVHEGLLNHIQEEEGDIFPRISKVWDEARLTQAGKKMQEMKSKKADAA
jgi:iron-sulfur cluster repair protein YtfE (RIC family)